MGVLFTPLRVRVCVSELQLMLTRVPTNLLEDIITIGPISKHNDHTSCGRLHHSDDPLEFIQVIVEGQSL